MLILDSKLPSLLRLLDDNEAGVRGAASDVLSRIDKDRDRVLRILVDNLETEVVSTVIVDLIESVARLVKRACIEGSEPLLEQVIADVSASNLNWKKVSLALSLLPYEYGPRRELWKATVIGASQEDISIICGASWMCDRSIAWALEGRR
jgi:HEAT repeat protein